MSAGVVEGLVRAVARTALTRMAQTVMCHPYENGPGRCSCSEQYDSFVIPTHTPPFPCISIAHSSHHFSPTQELFRAARNGSRKKKCRAFLSDFRRACVQALRAAQKEKNSLLAAIRQLEKGGPALKKSDASAAAAPSIESAAGRDKAAGVPLECDHGVRDTRPMQLCGSARDGNCSHGGGVAVGSEANRLSAQSDTSCGQAAQGCSRDAAQHGPMKQSTGTHTAGQHERGHDAIVADHASHRASHATRSHAAGGQYLAEQPPSNPDRAAPAQPKEQQLHYTLPAGSLKARDDQRRMGACGAAASGPAEAGRHGAAMWHGLTMGPEARLEAGPTGHSTRDPGGRHEAEARHERHGSVAALAAARPKELDDAACAQDGGWGSPVCSTSLPQGRADGHVSTSLTQVTTSLTQGQADGYVPTHRPRVAYPHSTSLTQGRADSHVTTGSLPQGQRRAGEESNLPGHAAPGVKGADSPAQELRNADGVGDYGEASGPRQHAEAQLKLDQLALALQQLLHD